MPKLKGKSMYTWITKADTKYDPCWKIDLIISAEEAKKAKEMGIRLYKTDELMNPFEAEMGPYKVKIKRLCEKRGAAKGQPNEQPRLVDADEAPLTDIVGNGSDVVVDFDLYTWSWGDKKGVGTDLKEVKVINLVEYVPKDTDEVKEETKVEDDF